jgi:hypothetical protein
MGLRTCVGFFVGAMHLPRDGAAPADPGRAAPLRVAGHRLPARVGLTLMAVNWKVIRDSMRVARGRIRSTNPVDDDPIMSGPRS